MKCCRYTNEWDLKRSHNFFSGLDQELVDTNVSNIQMNSTVLKSDRKTNNKSAIKDKIDNKKKEVTSKTKKKLIITPLRSNVANVKANGARDISPDSTISYDGDQNGEKKNIELNSNDKSNKQLPMDLSATPQETKSSNASPTSMCSIEMQLAEIISPIKNVAEKRVEETSELISILFAFMDESKWNMIFCFRRRISRYFVDIN